MIIVGVDEVGRGCLAGPLVAAAVVLDMARPIAGLNDSKKLSRSQRERLAPQILEQAIACGFGWVWPSSIDRGGITSAVKQAMKIAVTEIISLLPGQNLAIIIDGNYNYLPGFNAVRTLVRADASVAEVSAASIIAKVARDDYMRRVAAAEYPEYGFDRHVGYGTAQHIVALHQYGATKIHRQSFQPVRQLLLQSDA